MAACRRICPESVPSRVLAPRGRRRKPGSFAAWMVVACFALWLPCCASAQTLMPIRVSTPGPGSTVCLPLELAVRIGADRAEGVQLRLKFVDGGGVSLRDLGNSDADFGVFGFTAAMQAHLQDPRIIAIAATDDRAPWIMMVRRELRDAIRSPADLAGRMIGTHSASMTNVTASHQIAQLILQAYGIGPDGVQYRFVGQSWKTISAAISTGVVDAMMIDEPFATRAEREGTAFAVFNTAFPTDIERSQPVDFLRGAVITRRDRLNANPVLADKMVNVVRRSLAWIRTHNGAEIAKALGLSGTEAEVLTDELKKYPHQYSPDAKFSVAQLAATERFFRAVNAGNTQAAALTADEMVVDRWVGRKP